MTWQNLDQKLRSGAILNYHRTFGFWIENKDGSKQNINRHCAKALFTRDLVVIADKFNDFWYSYRSKYTKNEPNKQAAHGQTR